jgi:hypothetical protein
MHLGEIVVGGEANLYAWHGNGHSTRAGATREIGVELQGDNRDRVRALLQGKGFVVKG